ncbi:MULTISPECIES: phosphoserine phosphatase SerB [Gammaproteobacteria]|uniref:phosphoserine phosphatase SerB n=1 Tax=Gammaproteobacteria TaxID=1236 RepID=UPI000DCFE580|nr:MULTISPECIES: phosphoserine phosphatase SerB [Gammaproteobacteria]RTE86841.1 phosphoserine phosphatase SerB [Aliidiomarina sp. B3213]TCZ93370.1 phosphoserine phosphatase SerB [Lysobacter sp. N42]
MSHLLPKMHAPGMVVFDMDSTLIQMESIDAIAEAAGCGSEVAAVTEAAMQGQLDFKEALEQRVSKLTGVSEEVILQMCDNLPWSPGIDDLMTWFKSKRWRVVIVSGGFTWFADEAARRFKADHVVCNQLEVKNGRLTGQLIGDIIDAKAKQQTLLSLMNTWHLPQQQVVAVGDGANDIDMIQSAGTGIAYCGKAALKKVADICLDDKDISRIIGILSPTVSSD